MRKRNPIAVLLLPIVTLGIYGIYWLVSTKIELNKNGAKIPTAWLLIVPFVSIWWLWKYSEAVEEATNKELQGVLAFILLFLVSWIGEVIIQTYYNKIGAPAPAAPAGPAAPTTPATPAPPTPVVQ